MTKAAAKTKPKINAIAPWYGGNRGLAERVGEALGPCKWVGVPFAGGMAEIAFIRARTIVANDLHRWVIALASYVRSDCEEAQNYLRGQLFHPEVLREAQQLLKVEGHEATNRVALSYFVAVWMARSGLAGTDGELTGKLAVRWEAGGGDSRKRYDSAIDSLPYWAEQFQRCTFTTLDCFDFLPNCKDRPGHGIYCDPPFPDKGDAYTHKFDETKHRWLAEALAAYRETRVVCRFHDHPLIRELYPPGDAWQWEEHEGRNQANNKTPEVLILNRPAYTMTYPTPHGERPC